MLEVRRYIKRKSTRLARWVLYTVWVDIRLEEVTAGCVFWRPYFFFGVASCDLLYKYNMTLWRLYKRISYDKLDCRQFFILFWNSKHNIITFQHHIHEIHIFLTKKNWTVQILAPLLEAQISPLRTQCPAVRHEYRVLI